MKQIVMILCCFILLVISCYDNNNTEELDKNIKDEKYNDELLKAIRDNNLKYISSAFAPVVYFQYIIVMQKFSENDINDFNNKTGDLYLIFFDSEYFKDKISKEATSFREAILNSNHTSINYYEIDNVFLTSIAIAYNGFLYDIILNCNKERECEIVGLNISPFANEIELLSVMTGEKLSYIRLTKHRNLEASRKWHSTGIPKIILYDECKEEVYGPNKDFYVAYTGMESGSGGCVYIIVNEQHYLIFRHLNSINQSLVDAYKKKEKVPGGLAIGGNTKEIGIHSQDEPAKLTIEGRRFDGALLTEETIIHLFNEE